MSARPNGRIRIIWFGILFCAFIFIGRLYWLQMVKAQYYRGEADHQYYSPQASIFDRGGIYFTDKAGQEIAAATLKTGFTLAINPTLITDPLSLYDELSKIITLDKADFIAKASKKDDSYEEVAKRVSLDNGKKIDELNLKGLLLVREQWRYYPAGRLASQSVGFVGYLGDALTGRYGLERYYNDVLSRTNDTGLYSNFFADLFSEAEKSIGGTSEGDIITTIEPNVNFGLEQALAHVEDEYRSDSSGGIIINPKTGEIYAIAATPDFDPNFYSKETNQRVFSNPLVENVYELGSIVKPLTMAAGLDAGKVTAETTYDDKGFLVLDGSKIQNFDGKGRGVVNMQEVLNQSLNTGAAFVEQRLGNELFAQYMTRFGISDETGIDLPGEVHGITDNLKSPRNIEYATASYGQGIAVTPIEMVRALSSIANGGYLVTPYLVKSIRYTAGVTKNVAPDDKKRILKSATSGEISRMLVNVYDVAIIKGAAKMKDYSIAAKTGTAQIPAPGGGYYPDRYLHSFFGYFPAYDPKFLIFLYTINPKGVQYTSQTLTYPFLDLAKFVINYYNLPPDR